MMRRSVKVMLAALVLSLVVAGGAHAGGAPKNAFQPAPPDPAPSSAFEPDPDAEPLRNAQGYQGRYRTLWGVPKGRMSHRFNQYIPGYSWSPDSRHKGEDIQQKPRTPVYALHSGCVYRMRDDGSVSGYHQEITVRYHRKKGKVGPRYVLYGHMLRGSLRQPGTCFKRGAYLGRIGTRRDSNGTPPHAHIQAWSTKRAADSYTQGRGLVNPRNLRLAYGELHRTQRR